MAEAVVRTMEYPKWITRIPEDCFVGISNPCQSIEAARQQAIYSALSQILQAMGANYQLRHESILTGSLHNSHYELRERLSHSSQWFLRSVHQNIRKSQIQKTPGGYICYLLIALSEDKIQDLKRLSMGPKLAATVMKSSREGILVDVRESNGVGVTLSDYQIHLKTRNRHAGLITLFAWKVPKKCIAKMDGVLRQHLHINRSSQRFLIPNPLAKTGLKQILLGAESRIKITLHGYDEMGRKVSFPVYGL